MAGQALFFRACNIMSSNRCLVNCRILPVNFYPLTRGLKKDVVEKLKSLNIPEKPKKPPTPYIRYLTKHRSEVVKENPELKATEIFKKLAVDWRNISVEHKKPYVTEYEREYEVYQKKLQIYKASLTLEQEEVLQSYNREKKLDKQKRKIRKTNKETNKPKLPMGPYAAYLVEQSQMRNIPVKVLMKSLKEEWANLPEEDKAKYKNQYIKEKEIYDKELAQWKEKMIDEGRDDLVKGNEAKKVSRIKLLKVKKTE